MNILSDIKSRPRLADRVGVPVTKGITRRSFLGGVACVPPVFMTIAEAAFGPMVTSGNNRVEVVHTRVFAVGPHGGNPCPVVLDADSLTDGQMQELARRFGLDTAFILHPSSEGADLRIRYFFPQHEMGISGHATIAAITVARSQTTDIGSRPSGNHHRHI